MFIFCSINSLQTTKKAGFKSWFFLLKIWWFDWDLVILHEHLNNTIMKLFQEKRNDAAFVEDVAKLLVMYIPSKILEYHQLTETDLFDIISDPTIDDDCKTGELVTDIVNLVKTYQTGEKFEITLNR